jgi:hypothetical protein
VVVIGALSICHEKLPKDIVPDPEVLVTWALADAPIKTIVATRRRIENRILPTCGMAASFKLHIRVYKT